MQRVLIVDLALAATMLALSQLGASLNAGPRWRRALGVLLASATLVPPWFAAPSAVRGLLCLGAALAVMRAVDLFRDHRIQPASRRRWHVLSPVDSRRLHHAPRRLDGRSLGLALVWLVASAAGLWAASLGDGLLRWSGGLTCVYSFVEFLWTFARGLYALIGFATPPLHTNPISSRSVRELWGTRWSTPVSSWLHANVFKPFARRGLPRVGLVAAFLASAALHAYAVLIPAGQVMALVMLAYFFVQGLLVLLERLLGVQRWGPTAAHLWVIGVMLSTSPLFVEPFLQAVGFKPFYSP